MTRQEFERIIMLRAWLFRILGALAAITFGNSFTHIVDLAHDHHQEGWRGWAMAVSIEFLPTSSWLVRRYRERLDLPMSYLPYVAIGLGLIVSLAANEAKAGKYLDGWWWDVIFAALPVGVFTLIALMAETTLMHPMPEPASEETEESAKAEGAGDEERVADDTRGGDEEGGGEEETSRPQRQRRSRRRQGGRIGRDEYLAELVNRLRENSSYQIDYETEIKATGYSRSWLEKAWAQAKTSPAPTPATTLKAAGSDATVEDAPAAA